MRYTLQEWRALAKSRLPCFVYDYLEGGAGDELALERNRGAFERITFIPERLKDVTNCNLAVDLFGHKYPTPLVVAPTGLNGLLWRDGDLALAKAADRAAVPFVLSTPSTSSILDISKVGHGVKWFQLYVLSDRRMAERMLERARIGGFKVLVLTVDVPVNGNRERDQRNGFSPLFRCTPHLIADMLLHPRWVAQIIRGGIPRPVNVTSLQTDDTAQARNALLSRAMDRSLTWDSIAWLRQHWPGPIVLKGILRPEDGIRARECGVEGIVVSNHGGRQLDALPATIDVLQEIADATKSELTILVDSGFRRGSDVVKALSLGAKAVLIGRPLLYGLAVAGEEGAYSVLSDMIADIERTMTLIGADDTKKLNRSYIRQRQYRD